VVLRRVDADGDVRFIRWMDSERDSQKTKLLLILTQDRHDVGVTNSRTGRSGVDDGTSRLRFTFRNDCTGRQDNPGARYMWHIAD